MGIRAMSLLATLIAAASWFSAASVSAQGSEETELAEREARTRFESGRLAFADGRFEDALHDFRRAYELSPRPRLLYNIGQAADRLRRSAEALEAFEQYLTRSPEAENRRDVEARIRVLRQEIERARTPVEPAVAPEAETSSVPSVEEAPAPADGGGGGRLWTWIVGGVGVAAAVGSVLFWVDANARYDDLGRRCAPRCTDEEIDDSGARTAVTLTNVMLGVSLVAFAAAGVIFFLEGEGSQTSVAIGPGSVSVRGAF